MSTKKTNNTTDNGFVRLGKGFVNIFKRIGSMFSNVRQELKRVIWPTREKLIQTSVIVLAVIAIAAILLTAISEGAKFALDKAGFYDQKLATETTALPSTGETTTTETTVTVTDTTTIAETDATTAAQ